jgi:hypothetical protein
MFMSNQPIDDNDMPAEIDFGEGVCGLHHIPPGAKVLMPVSIERVVCTEVGCGLYSPTSLRGGRLCHHVPGPHHQEPYMQQPVWNFEQEPFAEPPDETSVNLRAYFDRVPDDKMLQFDPTWSDEEVTAWDGNFTEDGNLFLTCCERDVEIGEYREVLAEAIRYRDRVRAQYSQSAL